MQPWVRGEGAICMYTMSCIEELLYIYLQYYVYAYLVVGIVCCRLGLNISSIININSFIIEALLLLSVVIVIRDRAEIGYFCSLRNGIQQWTVVAGKSDPTGWLSRSKVGQANVIHTAEQAVQAVASQSRPIAQTSSGKCCPMYHSYSFSLALRRLIVYVRAQCMNK